MIRTVASNVREVVINVALVVGIQPFVSPTHETKIGATMEHVQVH